MNCRQLYAMGGEESKTITSTLDDFFEYDEVPNKDYLHKIESTELRSRLTVKCIVNYLFDHRRIWCLKSLWLDNKPFAILQEAGREGDDHRDRYITDEALFIECITFVNTLLHLTLSYAEDVVDEYTDMESLTNFYSHTLEDFIEDGYTPYYVDGMEVEVSLSEYYRWTTPLKEMGLLIQKATIIQQKKCNADSILVELHDFYLPKESFGYNGVVHINELEGDTTGYERLTIWVDDSLEMVYR